MSPVALIQEIGRLTHECYRLQVLCERNKNAPKGTNIYINELVKSGDLVWAPEGEQNAVFADAIPGPTNKVCATKILIFNPLMTLILSCGRFYWF